MITSISKAFKAPKTVHERIEATSLPQKKKATMAAESQANGKTSFAGLLNTTIKTMVSAMGKNASNAT